MLDDLGSAARSVVVVDSMTDNDIRDLGPGRKPSRTSASGDLCEAVNGHGPSRPANVTEPVLDQTSNGWQSFRHQLIYSLYLVSGAIEGSAEGQ